MTRSKRIFKKRKTKPPIPWFRKTVPDISDSAPIRMEHDNYVSEDILDIVNLSHLMSFLGKFVTCRACGGNVFLEYGDRQGLQVRISLKCSSCSLSRQYCNAKETSNDVYDINLRLIYAMRLVGQGEEGAKSFCAAMNLHNPPDGFESGEKILSEAIECVARDTMNRAIDESIWMGGNPGELSVVFDGSWQKRGLSSAGIVSATSLDSGKVIDVEILTKSCSCEGGVDGEHEVPCESKDYSGTCGEMEVAGVQRIFEHSKQRGVKYTKCLCDVNSSAFNALRESQPYGPDHPVVRLECIGYYIYKSIGTKLKHFRNRAPIMEDGKPIGGQKRLTNPAIEQIQMYCGLAIGRNTHSLDEMRKAVWAVYFHLVSSDSEPCHGLCPQGDDSWCKYHCVTKNKLPYEHVYPFHLPAMIMTHLKPIFTDLSNPELLKKCLRRKAQNKVEGLSHEIWTRIPKRKFVGLDRLKIGVFDAIATHNEGNMVRCAIFKKMGMDPGMGCISGMKNVDFQRIRVAEEVASKLAREARQESSAMTSLEELAGTENEPANTSVA